MTSQSLSHYSLNPGIIIIYHQLVTNIETMIKEGFYCHLFFGPWCFGRILLDTIEHLNFSSCNITRWNASIIKKTWVADCHCGTQLISQWAHSRSCSTEIRACLHSFLVLIAIDVL